MCIWIVFNLKWIRLRNSQWELDHVFTKNSVSRGYSCFCLTESCLCMYGVPTISRLLKIIGLFAEYSLFYWALLQKRPMILRSLLIVATPYLCLESPVWEVGSDCLRMSHETHTHTHTHTHSHTHTHEYRFCYFDVISAWIMSLCIFQPCLHMNESWRVTVWLFGIQAFICVTFMCIWMSHDSLVHCFWH